MPPRFSLVVVTMQGRYQLTELCLASIAAQTFQDFETIVVDQGRSAAMVEIAERFPRVRYLSVSADGLSASRNRGIAVARGELLAFPDDDARLAPDFLAHCEEAFRATPSLGLFSGTVVDPDTRHRILRFPGSPARLTIWNVLRRHCSTSIVIPRSVLQSDVGAFDPALGVGAGTPFGSGEETDLVLRVLMSRRTGRYDPAAIVYHPESRLTSQPPQKVASYGRGAGACFRKLVHRFGWWPLGALWLWTLTRVLGGTLIAGARARATPARLRLISFRSRLEGWFSYTSWLAAKQRNLPATDLRKRSVDA